MMTALSNIGLTVFFSPELPNSNDPAGFEALTWTEVEEAIQAPQFGISHSTTDVPGLKNGFSKSVKAGGTGTESQTSYAIINGSLGPGQILLRNASRSPQGFGSFKIVRGTGANNQPQAGDHVEYAQGIVKDFTKNEKTTSSFEGFQVSFKQNDFEVDSVEPA